MILEEKYTMGIPRETQAKFNTKKLGHGFERETLKEKLNIC